MLAETKPVRICLLPFIQRLNVFGLGCMLRKEVEDAIFAILAAVDLSEINNHVHVDGRSYDGSVQFEKRAKIEKKYARLLGLAIFYVLTRKERPH